MSQILTGALVRGKLAPITLSLGLCRLECQGDHQAGVREDTLEGFTWQEVNDI